VARKGSTGNKRGTNFFESAAGRPALPGPTAPELASAPNGRVCKSGSGDVAVRQRDRGLSYWVTILVTCVAVVLLTDHLPFGVGLVIALALGAVVGLILRLQRRLR